LHTDAGRRRPHSSSCPIHLVVAGAPASQCFAAHAESSRKGDPATPCRRRWGRRHLHLHGRRRPRRGHTPRSTTTCASLQSSSGLHRSQTSTAGGGTSAMRWCRT
jgi:hypothetical protein